MPYKTLKTLAGKHVSHTAKWPPQRNKKSCWELQVVGELELFEHLSNCYIGCHFKVGPITFEGLVDVIVDPFSIDQDLTTATLVFLFIDIPPTMLVYHQYVAGYEFGSPEYRASMYNYCVGEGENDA